MTSFWDHNANVYDPTHNKEKKEIVKQIIHLLEFSCIYDLQKSKDETETSIRALLRYDNLPKTHRLFDIAAVKVLTNLFLPLAQQEEDGYSFFSSVGKSTLLWNWLVDWSFEEVQLEGLSLEDINSNPMLPMFIKTFIDFMAEETESGNITNSARSLVRDIVAKAPKELHNKMPYTEDRKTAGRMCLMGILKDMSKSKKHKETFKTLSITLPEAYDQV